MNLPFQMLNMPIVTAQYWGISYGMSPGETTQDLEGMQTMRAIGNNLAWLLKKTGGQPAPGIPEGEEWTPTNFIR